jgi:hypothetical protein
MFFVRAAAAHRGRRKPRARAFAFIASSIVRECPAPRTCGVRLISSALTAFGLRAGEMILVRPVDHRVCAVGSSLPPRYRMRTAR